MNYSHEGQFLGTLSFISHSKRQRSDASPTLCTWLSLCVQLTPEHHSAPSDAVSIAITSLHVLHLGLSLMLWMLSSRRAYS